MGDLTPGQGGYGNYGQDAPSGPVGSDNPSGGSGTGGASSPGGVMPAIGPVNAASGSDQTVWPSLYSQADADNGSLEMAAGTAQQCAQACETLLGTIVAILNAIPGYSSCPTIAVAPDVTSGTALQRVYNNKFTELADRLNDHQTVVTDMGNTFVAAGKAYEQAENDSSVNFSSISFDNPTPASLNSYPQTVTVPSVSGTPTTPLGPSGPTAYSSGNPGVMRDPSISISAENANSLSWNDLYQVGQSISAQSVANFGGAWYQLAKQWQSAVTTFGDQINSTATQGAWSGSGAKSAVAAVNNYVTRADYMTSDLNALGDNIVYTSGWLQDTQNNMPDTASQPSCNHQLGAFRQNFTNIYVTGLNYTIGDIPLIQDANPVTNPIAGPSGASGPDGSSSDSSGSSSGPSGSASGPDSSWNGPSGSASGNDSTTTGPAGPRQENTPNYNPTAFDAGTATGAPVGPVEAPQAGASPYSSPASQPAASYNAPTGASAPATSPYSALSDPGATAGTPAAAYSAPSGALGVSGAGGVSASGVSGSMGVSGATGATGSAAAAADILSIFSEVLQLLGSAIPAMQQLGSQLLQQLPAALQQLGQQVQQGAVSIGQAIQQAATDLGGQVATDLGLPTGPTGPTGHHDHDHDHDKALDRLFPRAAMPAQSDSAPQPDPVMAAVADSPATPLLRALTDDHLLRTLADDVTASGPTEPATD